LHAELGTADQDGFTLLELVVVIAILALVTLLVIPRLPAGDAASLRDSARAIATAMRFLTDRAATTRSIYQMRLDLTDSTATIARLNPDGTEASPDDALLARRLIADSVQLEDVVIPRLGKISEGEVLLRFSPAGSEGAIIHLKGKNKGQYTVMAYPNGKVTVAADYLEPAE
jgi:general secretion pathway protein H